MGTTKALGSPIQMNPPPYNRGTSCTAAEGGDQQDATFVKYGSPFTMDRLFIGLDPTDGGITAIELIENRPVSFVLKVKINDRDIKLDRLRPTCHRHLANLKEAFVCHESLLFIYERWDGVSLRGIQELRPTFELGEVEVATICCQILHGLHYIHNTLGISHGAISEQNIYIDDNGDVRIGRIGESMIRGLIHGGEVMDISATLNIARKLLGLQGTSGGRGTVGLLAHDFTAAPRGVTIEQLLQHPFMRLNAGSWCLRPINLLCTIARR
ncbi:hypothetical protein BDV39DRAFT_199327 [Aspergillus sergii]|uniref:Protein kinase domain-containing protein n=1 Tax=Aspergillus sergii TaxID=1034303 RepID=A0A5N6XLH3_9EURO|nr:hypothetical protein BDV39DRAFT_199327 [Aspergillus sergii]